MLNIREIDDRFGLSLHLYPIFSDNLITHYQPNPVDGENMQKIRKLLLGNSAGAHKTIRPLVSSKNEIGWYFKVDLHTVPARD